MVSVGKDEVRNGHTGGDGDGAMWLVVVEMMTNEAGTLNLRTQHQLKNKLTFIWRCRI